MSNNQQIMMNRIKAVLAERQRTNRWLATQMGKSENTISRWCSNKSQPSIIQLQEIANLLDVDIRQLLTTTKVINDLCCSAYEIIRYRHIFRSRRIMSGVCNGGN